MEVLAASALEIERTLKIIPAAPWSRRSLVAARPRPAEAPVMRMVLFGR